jgi:hypothetical protein
MENQPVNPGVPLNELGKSPAQPTNSGSQEPIFGKYADLAAAQAGYNELLTTLTNRGQELDLTKQRLGALESVLMEMQDAPQGQPKTDPFKALADAGVDPAEFIAGVRDLVRAELEPVTKGVAAQAQFELEHPEFRAVQPEVSQFIATNAKLTKRFNTIYQNDPFGAMEWALDRFKETKREPVKSAADDPTKGKLPSSGPTAERGPESRAEFVENHQKALDYYHKYGNMTPMLDNLIAGGLKPNRG